MSYLELDEPTRASRRRTAPAAGVIIGALLVVLVAAAAYAAGTSHAARVRVLTGDAYVGDHQASIKVGGWVYGIVGSVPWVDTDGNSSDSGWPSCLNTSGTTVRIRFGEIPVSGPQQDSWRAVAWVDCRGAAVVH